MDNQEILERAIKALNTNLFGEKAILDYVGKSPFLTVMGRRFACIIDPNLTPGKMVEKHQENKNAHYLYVTVNATPKMLELAKAPDINVLDCAGNFNIQYVLKNGNVVFMLANKGEKPVEDPTPKVYSIFTDKGLRVIFYLLMDKKNIARPYREIVEATGVAIGTVKNIIDGMIFHQFTRVEGNKRFLINTDRLLTLWSANYSQTLKPKLQLGRFAFRDERKRQEWKAMNLPTGIPWGGEPAVTLADGYLDPGEFTIYTDVPAATLMKTGALIPDKNGEITVYKKFWKGNAMPAVLIYADLIDTANDRCIETAQILKENELKYLI